MNNKKRKATGLISGILTCMLLAPAPAHAALIAYEGFDYVPGSDIRGQNGGSGWAAGSSWAGYDPSVTWPGLITSSGLSFGKLDIQGKALTTATTPGTTPSPSSALYWRNLPQFGQEGSTLYVSFLFRPELDFGYYGGVNLTDEFGNGIFVGKSGASGYNNYGLEGPLNDIESSGVPVATGETDLIILKAQFLPGNDIYSIFVNPALDGVEPGAASASKNNFDPGNPLIGTTFIFNNYGNYTIDEIRIGTTYADVTPIPEPGTLSMIAFGLSVIIGRNRIRRSAALNNLSFQPGEQQ